MRKIIVSFLLISCLLFSSCSCGPFRKLYVSGDFVYVLFNNDLLIQDFSEEGKQKETIIVPKYLDGYEVLGFGARAKIDEFVRPISGTLQKFFLPNCTLTKMLLTKCSALKKVLYNFKPDDNPTLFGLEQLPEEGTKPKLYISSIIYEQSLWLSSRAQRANVSFRLNYEDEVLNGYYWIDDLDDEKITVIPSDPERDGFSFGGWYKDPECVHPWNFAEEKVPAKVYDEDGAYLYRETNLYAKWKIL